MCFGLAFVFCSEVFASSCVETGFAAGVAEVFASTGLETGFAGGLGAWAETSGCRKIQHSCLAMLSSCFEGVFSRIKYLEVGLAQQHNS